MRDNKRPELLIPTCLFGANSYLLTLYYCDENA